MHRSATIGWGVLALALAACSTSGDEGASGEPVPAATSITTTSSTTVASAPLTQPQNSDPSRTAPSATDPPPTQPSTSEASPPPTAGATAGRPYDLFVPSGYDAAIPTPLVLLLHGYGASGDIQESYFELEPLAESRGFLYVHPDGLVDSAGNRFWNATDACCAFGASDAPDDSAYLMSIIEQVSAEYNVDPKSIFLAGHSNGGFMSHRMACEHADTIAAIVSLAGATFADPSRCAPSEPVSVLQIHGTDDQVIRYGGGSFRGGIHPGARQTVESWADLNRCGPSPAVDAEVLDLDRRIGGGDTAVEEFSECDTGAAVALWTIGGGGHVPDVTTDFSAGIVDFLLAHPKP